eukprot:2853535-Pyramimonas_sp.AAC.1
MGGPRFRPLPRSVQNRLLELSWGSLGGYWSSGLGARLGLSWGPLGSPGRPPGAILKAIDQKEEM